MSIIRPKPLERKISHILSYDLKDASRETYEQLDNEIRKKFNGNKPLLSFWELNTSFTCEQIVGLVSQIGGIQAKIRVYRVDVLDKSKYPE